MNKRGRMSAGWIPALLLCVMATRGAGGAEGDPVASLDTMGQLRGVAGELKQVVHLLGYHERGDRGGGHFVWRADSDAEANGGTVIAVEGEPRGRWHRMADDVKATYFGARGDGEHDDTAAIQAAIDSVSSTDPPGVISEGDRQVGGTVLIPKGKYRITDTLLIGPHTTLEGVGSAQGFQRRSVVENDEGTVLIGDFADPKKWMISTAVYHRKGERRGELLGYREITSGKPYDRGAVSRANGVRVRDLLLIGQENDAGDVPYGGVRFQACPGAVIEGVGVYNVDVAWMLNAGWGLTMRDCQSQSHLYGLLALYSVNGLHVDSCYINRETGTERTIDDSNHTPPARFGPDLMKQYQMPEAYFYQTRGIHSHYGHNITLNNVITEHWDIARFHAHGAIADTGSWIEGNKELGYALVTVDFDLRTPNIYAPGMIEEGRFMRAGTNVRATIHQSSAFPITYASRWQRDEKRISVNVADPDAQGWAHEPFIAYPNRRKGHIRVAGDDDEAVENDRLADTTHYVDLRTALSRIAASDRRDWTIHLKDGATCAIRDDHALGGKRLTLVADEPGRRPVVHLAAGPDGNGGRLIFRDGGGLELRGVDLRVDRAEPDLDPTRRAVMVIDGGHFTFAATDADLYLGDDAAGPGEAVALMRTEHHAASIDATLANTRIRGGDALLIEGEGLSSTVRCRAVNSTASPALLRHGRAGWGNTETTVTGTEITPHE